MSETRRALIYCRVSTRSQEEEGASLESQAAACHQWAASNGCIVTNTLSEVYTGAELYDRPVLSHARAAIQKRQCEVLVCYSIDRLSRDPIHLAILAMECDRARVQLEFVSEPLDNTPEGQLIRYVKGYAAQVEREKIRERCIRGKRQVALSGRIHRAGTDLYGYRRDKARGVREVYEPEASIVRHIFEGVASGLSLRSIARQLNTEGVPSPAVRKRVFADGRLPRWGKSCIARIVAEESYKGEAIAWRWRSAGKKSSVIRRSDSEHIRLPDGVVPAIVSPRQTVQTGRERKRRWGEEGHRLHW